MWRLETNECDIYLIQLSRAWSHSAKLSAKTMQRVYETWNAGRQPCFRLW